MWLCAADAAQNHAEAYNLWRERPADFWIDGMNPLNEVFNRAKQAWQGESLHRLLY